MKSTQHALGQGPLVSGDQSQSPLGEECPVCGKSMDGMKTFVALHAGALLENKRRGSFEASERLRGFMWFSHEAPPIAIDGQLSAVSAEVDVAIDVVGGQFRILTCSSRCMKRLLGAFVDEVARKTRTFTHSARRRKRASDRKCVSAGPDSS